jgi:dolichol kinase
MADTWRLRLRNDLHLTRKVFHCGMGIFMAALYVTVLSKVLAVSLLLGFFVFLMAVETVRLKSPKLNAVTLRLFSSILRQNEVDRMSGTPFYVGSVLLCVIVFPKSIAILSILFLAIGDPISSVMGILYGDRSIRFKNGKSLIGTASGMGICFLVALGFLHLHDGMPLSSAFLIALFGGIAGGGSEMIPLDIDDNFSIPLVSGLAMWVVDLIVGW